MTRPATTDALPLTPEAKRLFDAFDVARKERARWFNDGVPAKAMLEAENAFFECLRECDHTITRLQAIEARACLELANAKARPSVAGLFRPLLEHILDKRSEGSPE